MEIQNNVEEQRNIENSPEGRRKKRNKSLLSILAFIVLLAVYYFIAAPILKGKPFEITIDGAVFKPGESQLSVLYGAGFELYNINNAAIPGTETLKAKSYANVLRLYKDNRLYGYIEIINYSSKEKPIVDCIIRKWELSIDEASDVEGVTIAGLSYEDMTPDKLKEALGKAKGDENFLSFKNGNHYLEFSYENGVLKEIQSYKEGN